MNGHPEFKAILDRLWELHCEKGDDYGSEADPLLNIREAADYGVPPWLAALLRANDKVVRLKQFAKRRTLKNESVEDSILDLASYAILTLVLMREQPHDC